METVQEQLLQMNFLFGYNMKNVVCGGIKIWWGHFSWWRKAIPFFLYKYKAAFASYKSSVHLRRENFLRTNDTKGCKQDKWEIKISL